MSYRVVWKKKATHQLARVWTDAADRPAVNRAVDETDALLAADPENAGEDYFGDRHLQFPVMWVLYRVLPDGRAVVLEVGRPGQDLPHDEPDIESDGDAEES